MIKPIWIVGTLFIALATIGAILPQKTNRAVERNAEELLLDVLEEAYVLDTDELADLLIQKDPSILLIDVRAEADYKKYSLPGAINIPLDSLLNEDWGGYLDQDVKRNVFFSNGSTLAVQAWMLVHQRGYPNNYYLKGGLNEWFATIIEPKEPAVSAPQEAFRLYQTRVAASQYFTGKTGIPAPASGATNVLKPRKRKAKKAVEGGCS
jgi:rhodanese-related sulfurtransferase